MATRSGVNTCIARAEHLQTTIPAILAGKRETGTVFVGQATPLGDQKRFLAHAAQTRGAVYIDCGAARALVNKKSLFAAGILSCTGDFRSRDCVIVMAPRDFIHIVPSSAENLISCERMTREILQRVSEEAARLNSLFDYSSKSTLPSSKIQKLSSSSLDTTDEPSGSLSVSPAIEWIEIARGVVNYCAEDCRKLCGAKSTEYEKRLGHAPKQEEIVHRDDLVLTLLGQQTSPYFQQPL